MAVRPLASSCKESPRVREGRVPEHWTRLSCTASVWLPLQWQVRAWRPQAMQTQVPLPQERWQVEHQAVPLRRAAPVKRSASERVQPQALGHA